MIHELVNLGLVTVGPFVAVGATAKVALWLAHRGDPAPAPKPARPAKTGPRPAIQVSATVAERKPAGRPALVGEVLPARRQIEAGGAR
jgi:hypothetical protein